MARRFTFGEVPFDFILPRIVESDDFAADAALVAEIPEQKFASLVQELHAESHFVDFPVLEGIAKKHLTNPEQSADLSKFVIRMHGLFADSSKSISEIKPLFRDVVGEKLTKFEDEASRLAAADRILTLATETPGLKLQYKASKLSDERGPHLEAVEIVTDIRPIYNETAGQIEGAFPVTLLNLCINDPSSDDDQSVRVEISEAVLSELILKAQRAVQKIATAKQFLKGKDVAVPTVGAINNPGGE